MVVEQYLMHGLSQIDKVKLWQYQTRVIFKKSRVLRLNDVSSKYLKKRKRYKNFVMNSKAPNIFVEAIKPNKNDIQNQDRQIFKYSKRSITSKEDTKNILFKQRKPLINKGEIYLSDINRPFSILLREADIVPLLNSTEAESKCRTVLLFKFELFSSNVSICVL